MQAGIPSGRDARRRPAAGSRAGFSLVELLVVCTIMAVLLGIGVGGFARMSQGSLLDANERMVRATLLRSRMEARDLSALSEVTLVPRDPKSGAPARVRAAHAVVGGTWHLEDAQGGRAQGGRNRFARLRGVSKEEHGFMGACGRFKGGTLEGPAHVDLDPRRGFDLELYVRFDPDSDQAQVASYGTTFSLELGEKGSVFAIVTREETEQAIRLESAKGVVEPGAWTPLGLSFDGIEAILRVHHVVEARKKVAGPLRAPESRERFRVGSGDYQGLIDEITYLTMFQEDDLELDPDIDFQLKSPLRIRFAADGRLDPRLHKTPIKLVLGMEEERVTIGLDLGGMVR